MNELPTAHEDDDDPIEEECVEQEDGPVYINESPPPKIQAAVNFVSIVLGQREMCTPEFSEMERTMDSALRCLQRYFNSEN